MLRLPFTRDAQTSAVVRELQAKPDAIGRSQAVTAGDDVHLDRLLSADERIQVSTGKSLRREVR